MGKVKCIKRIFRSDNNCLTIGKEYEVVKEERYSYVIVDDNGKLFPYDKHDFECV